jgi:Cu(I)/Ag(I) efflux system membrane fusion protein
MNRTSFMIAALALLAGVAAGMTGMALFRAEPASDVSGERDILYWVAPMDSSYRRDAPGKSPMGMDLIPVYAGEAPASEGADIVRINPAVENNIGVRTARVQREDFHRHVATVGYVRPVDALTSAVDVRSEGWIEDLRVSTMGDVVAEGDLLFRMYSPELVAAQSEYLQARRVGRSQLVEAARARLIALGMTSGQIASVGRSGQPARLVDVHAARSGIVIDLSVREGEHVHPSATLMTIADLSSVWVVADVFEDEAQAVAVGLAVEMRSPAYPGRVWSGTVEYVYPTVDPQSRSVPVRMRFDNPQGDLRPGSFVNVVIKAQPRSGVLTVPREAVIRTGRSDRVILAEGEGRYRPARVVPGTLSEDRIEIVEGLAEGERVVVSSQFLIDSEASLQGALLRMSPPGAVDEDTPASPQEVDGTGTVTSVMAGHGMIDLDHAPIPQIGWPAMTMPFRTVDGVDLSGLAAGDRVTFTLRETEGGDWLISDIEPAGAMSAHDMHDMDDIPEMEETDHSGHADPHGGHRP